MPFRIKVRLTELGRSQVDLIAAIREKYNIKIDPAELSKILRGTLQTPKAEKVLSAAHEIVSSWELEQHRA